MKRRALLLALPCLGWAQTERRAQPVYRCGNTVSDRPCSGDATAAPVPFDDPSRADTQAARQRAKDDAKEAKALQKEREKQERQRGAKPQSLSGPSPEPAAPTKRDQRKAGGGKSKPAEKPKGAGQSDAKGKKPTGKQRAANQPA